MNRNTDLFKAAMERCDALIVENPDNASLQSIRRQIEYLISLESGLVDRSQLRNINIGLLTVREVEPLNDEVATELFHKVSSAARKM